MHSWRTEQRYIEMSRIAWRGGHWLLDASVDTHPKDGDVKQAPLVSGAGR